MKSKTDMELMALIKQKHRPALEELYERYINLVYSFVYKFCNGDNEKTKEICQLIFLRLWTTKGSYDASKGSFVNWLLTISRNICIDYFRKEETHLRFDGSFEDDRMLKVADLSNKIEEMIESNYINEAKKCLTAPQQRLLNLFYWKGYTLAEIAEIEREPIGTIKNRLHQALKQLRKYMGDEETR